MNCLFNLVCGYFYVCCLESFYLFFYCSVVSTCCVRYVVGELFVEMLSFLFVCYGCGIVKGDCFVWCLFEFFVCEACDGVPEFV